MLILLIVIAVIGFACVSPWGRHGMSPNPPMYCGERPPPKGVGHESQDE